MSQIGRLHGKVAVVTGAASGIGKAVCKRFLAEGSKVIMADCNRELLLETIREFDAKYKGSVAMTHCDVAEENAGSEVFATAYQQFGLNCNVLVNSAGIAPSSPIIQTTTDAWNRVVAVNLIGVFALTKEFLRRLELGKYRKASDASIVNIASLSGKLGMENRASYAATKGGVIAFTKTTCIEVGKYGVRCNAVLPGFIQTPILDGVDKAYLEAGQQLTPMRRFGKPSEVANACLFLASDESSYVNGASLEVSGGFMA